MGHSNDIVESAIDSQLSMVFFHGYHHVPGGFASFQLSSAGIPQLFFEMIPQSIVEKDVTLYSTNSISKFVQKTVNLLANTSELQKLSEKQLEKIEADRNIEKTIVGLQDYLLSKAGKQE